MTNRSLSECGTGSVSLDFGPDMYSVAPTAVRSKAARIMHETAGRAITTAGVMVCAYQSRRTIHRPFRYGGRGDWTCRGVERAREEVTDSARTSLLVCCVRPPSMQNPAVPTLSTCRRRPSQRRQGKEWRACNSLSPCLSSLCHSFQPASPALFRSLRGLTPAAAYPSRAAAVVQ